MRTAISKESGAKVKVQVSYQPQCNYFFHDCQSDANDDMPSSL